MEQGAPREETAEGTKEAVARAVVGGEGGLSAEGRRATVGHQVEGAGVAGVAGYPAEGSRAEAKKAASRVERGGVVQAGGRALDGTEAV